MSKLLEQVLAQVYRLPESEQDSIAAIIQEELADDRRWDEQFSKSQAQMARLAAKARKDTKAGRVRNIGFDDL